MDASLQTANMAQPSPACLIQSLRRQKNTPYEICGHARSKLHHVRSDLVFDNEQLKSLLRKVGSQLQNFPPRRHYKNVLESKSSSI